MSKITFRADDELIEQLEEFESSKSEVMRQALRQFLEGSETDSSSTSSTADASLDEVITDRVDAMIADRLQQTRRQPQDVNVNITLDTAAGTETSIDGDERKTAVRDTDTASDRGDDAHSCQQCGEGIAGDHVYCPNCGEKASRRVFCDCGDEIRSDWAFCPSCGRRTPAAGVLDNS